MAGRSWVQKIIKKVFVPYLTEAGYPIWWGVAPRIIDTFLESYDFSGKTVIPFCTSGGSGLGRSGEKLHADVGADVKWGKGMQINHANERDIKKLLEQI